MKRFLLLMSMAMICLLYACSKSSTPTPQNGGTDNNSGNTGTTGNTGNGGNTGTTKTEPPAIVNVMVAAVDMLVDRSFNVSYDLVLSQGFGGTLIELDTTGK